MEHTDIKDILNEVSEGTLTVEDAVTRLKLQPYEDIGYAKVDHHRRIMQGVAETIFGEGKTAEQIAGIIRSMKNHGQELVLATRVSPEKAEDVEKLLGGEFDDFVYSAKSRILTVGRFPAPSGIGRVVIATGGTSDIPVAEEAAVTAEALGNEVVRLYDVGVAGIHRLLDNREYLMTASVIIAIAGMEGALASVVGGMADCPVIAVPTSVGYGASFGGLSALLSMLNSCASGVSVVNIDNGYGAGYLAHMINHMGDRR